MKHYLFLIGLLLSGSLFAKELNYSLVPAQENILVQELAEASRNQIVFNYQWLDTDQLNHDQRKFLNIKEGSDVRTVIFSSFNFYLPKGLHKYNSHYFENVELLEKLSGMSFEKTKTLNEHKIRFKPHPLKTITASSKLKRVGKDALYQRIFHLKNMSNDILIHQTVEKFSDYLDRTDIVTEIHSENGGTRFTIYSMAILNVNESQSSMLPITKKAMVSKMKDQMKLTPDIFYNY